MSRKLKSHEQVNIFLLKTKSSEIEWINKDNGLYIATVDNVQLRLFQFQSEVRGHPHIILDIIEGYTKNRIREPEPHISAVPLGKILHYAARAWNFFFSFVWTVSVPALAPETQEEIENEQLRVAIQELQKTIIAKTGE